MKVPAINKTLQCEIISTDPTIKPVTTPRKHNKLDRILKQMALLSEQLFLINIEKSPISWGSSWKKMANAVPTPAVIEVVAKAAPIAKPSAKLCNQSPVIIIQIEGWFDLDEWWVEALWSTTAMLEYSIFVSSFLACFFLRWLFFWPVLFLKIHI